MNKHDGHLVADDLQESQYLEGVLFETIRIHPPLMVMQRICTKTYQSPTNKQQSQPVTIHPGTPVSIPTQAIHMQVIQNVCIFRLDFEL